MKRWNDKTIKYNQNYQNYPYVAFEIKLRSTNMKRWNGETMKFRTNKNITKQQKRVKIAYKKSINQQQKTTTTTSFIKLNIGEILMEKP